MFTEERIGEILRQLSLLRYPETVPAIGWKMLRTTGEQRPTPSESRSGWSTIPADGIWGRRLRILRLRRRPHAPGDLRGASGGALAAHRLRGAVGCDESAVQRIHKRRTAAGLRCQPSRAHAHRVCKARRVLFCFPFRLYRRAELSSGI